ncbi:FUSC family protein [Luedemannella helvata]
MPGRDRSAGHGAAREERGVWRPSLWLRALAAAPPARWPVGRSMRAGVGVGLPVLIASLAGQMHIGMWIGLGALGQAVGEREQPYRARFRQIWCTVPIAASAYGLGLVSHLPVAAAVVVMTAVAFGCGIVSGYSAVLSAATMQAMLIAAIAIGLPTAAPYWPPALLYLIAGVWFSALMAVEAVLARDRPQRAALAAMLGALADLAQAQAEGQADLGPAQRTAVGAIDRFEQAAMLARGHAQGPTREYTREARICRAADQLAARLLAPDAEADLSARAAARLRQCADAAVSGRPPPPRTDGPGTLVRLTMLETAIWAGAEPQQAGRASARARLSAPGPALLAGAARLALCTGLAYVAFFALPLPHGYWIPLTVALVMKPDLGSVFGRAVLRCAGTVGGAVVAVLFTAVSRDAVFTSIAIGAVAACLPWAKSRSYALQTLCTTPPAMLLIDLVAPDTHIVPLAADRIAATFIGGVVTIVAGYLIWPAVRRPDVEGNFAAALGDLADYARAVARGHHQGRITAARRRCYQRLSDTRLTLQRMLAEPPPAGALAWAWIPVVGAAERVADQVTGISATRRKGDPATLSALADDIDALASVSVKDDSPVRHPAVSRHGDCHDAAVRELADDLNGLSAMLSRESSPPGTAPDQS